MSAAYSSTPSPWWRLLAPPAFLGLLSLLLAASGALYRIDLVLYDALIAVDRPAPSDEIALVVVDEASLQQLGRWPWSRAVHARLLDRMREAGARAVGLQVIFSEPGDAADDSRLAEAIARFGRVVLPVFPEVASSSGGVRAALPLPELAARARLGHIDTALDADGIARSVYLQAGPGEVMWPHISLALLEAGDRAPAALPGERGPAESSANRRLWRRDFRALVPFAASGFPTVSYAEVLNDPAVAASLRDKLVLVGVTAAGFSDELATPVVRGGARMDGVEFNAHIANALLQQRLVQGLLVPASLALSVLLALLPLFLFARVRTPLVPAIAALCALGILLLATALLRWANLWFPPAAAFAGALLSYPLWSWFQLRTAAAGLLHEKGELRATLQSIGDAVITTDRAGRVAYLNPAAEALMRVTASKVRGLALDDVCELEDEYGRARRPAHEVFVAGLQEQLGAGLCGRLTVRGGETRAVRVSGRPVRNAQGTIDGAVLAVTDMSDIAAMTERIEYQATHDALTGLPNRVLLRDRLLQALSHARRSDECVAVLFIDLDQFKHVNDSLGHSEGDVLLQKLAQRLRAAVREGDTVSRWGGDEFVVLLDGPADRTVAEAVAHKIAATLRMPLLLAREPLTITASIGGALSPEDGEDVETLFRRADAAMYRAKTAGRDGVRFFAPEMDEAAAERLALERALREAIDCSQFVLFYQPQVRLTDGKLVGVEALVRWRHPTAGLLGPARFIGLAEDSGLIIGLGSWVLLEACRQLQKWRAAGLPPVPVSVNVSPRQFAHAQFEATVAAALDDAGIAASDLKLEITESVLATDLERSAAVMRRLRERGVAVSIDDFGVDYSALRYLKQFPVAELKIDQGFVSHVTTSPQDAAIAEAIIALARSLRLAVVGEGVETIGQLEFLRDRGCDVAQGFVLSRPLPAAEMSLLLERGDTLPLPTI